MFEGIKAGWRLAKSVRSIVAGNRSLLLYPFVSALLGILLFAVTLVGVFFIPLNVGAQWKEIAAFVGAYLLTALVSTYFLVAMLIDFRSTSSGNPVGMGKALGLTRQYARKIFLWAMFYTIIVMIIRMLESRTRGLASLVIGIAGSIGITVATFFAVPAILEKKAGPIQAVRESVSTITRTMGPAFGGVAYIDLYTLLFVFAGMGLIIVSLLLPFLGIFSIALLIAGLVLMVFGMVQNYTFFNILKLVIYDYYNGVPLPQGISESMLSSAIKTRRAIRR